MAKSNLSIYSALAANIVIAVTKFIAGIFSNSSAMIAEGVHSVADTLNQLLILFGIRQSKKPPDALRPFGYGKELYFWSFIVSIIIFGLGVEKKMMPVLMNEVVATAAGVLPSLL